MFPIQRIDDSFLGGKILYVAPHGDGRHMAIGTDTGSVGVFSILENHPVFHFPNRTRQPIQMLEFGPHGRLYYMRNWILSWEDWSHPESGQGNVLQSVVLRQKDVKYGNVTCWLLTAHELFIGTESGRVVSYAFENSRSTSNLFVEVPVAKLTWLNGEFIMVQLADGTAHRMRYNV